MTPDAEPSALDVFGTLEPPAERRELRAGPLAAVLEAGQLREVRWHGVLVLRGVAFLLRDAAWGTLPVALSDLAVEEGPDGFRVAYRARHDGPSGRLAFDARIEGAAGGGTADEAEGRLLFEATAAAATDFTTNRMGFVVLHPDLAAGLPLEVGHSDGTVEATAFPRRISPDQPAFDVVALTHAPAPGVAARVAFEGGVWEMEDQRNWADASFKTYVRPLAWPRPYVIPAGATERQAVTLTLAGQPEGGAGAEAAPRFVAGSVPPLHLRLAHDGPVPTTLPLPDLAHGLILRLDVAAPDQSRLAAAAALARAHGLVLAVEALFPQRDPAGEAAACLDAIGGYGVGTLLVAAGRDLRTRPSGTLPPGEAPLGATLAALRARGFAGRLGAGVPAFFTEFNRNPPPAADLAFFGACPIVHAADDVAVMETPGVLPAILDSAAALLPGVPLWPGPLALAPAVNPYGPGLAETDGTSRTPLARRDPRHGALFGAAHLVAVLAAVAGRVEAAAPLFLDGPSSLAAPDGAPLPLAFVHAEAAHARGTPLAEPSAAPGLAAPNLAALAWEADGRRTTLLANTGAAPIRLPPPPGATGVHRLGPGAAGWRPLDPGSELRLPPYAVVRVVAAGGGGSEASGRWSGPGP